MPTVFLLSRIRSPNENKLTGMRSLVDLQILRTGKHLSATVIRTRERLLTRMHSDMVHQLVLRLERTPIAATTQPEARVHRTLGSSDMLHRKMRHNILHRVERLAARLPVTAIPNHWRNYRAIRSDLRVNPEALHLLFELDLVVWMVARIP